MVRRIARPAAGKRHDLAEHQLDLRRRVGAIEDRAHVAQRASADLPATARLVRAPARARTPAPRTAAGWRSRRPSARSRSRAVILTLVPAATCTQLADSSNSELRSNANDRSPAVPATLPLISSHAVSHRGASSSSRRRASRSTASPIRDGLSGASASVIGGEACCEAVAMTGDVRIHVAATWSTSIQLRCRAASSMAVMTCCTRKPSAKSGDAAPPARMPRIRLRISMTFRSLMPRP